MRPFLLLTWFVIVVGQMHGCRCCLDNERTGLLELKTYINSISEYQDFHFARWSNDTRSDCCGWERVTCDRTSGRVIGLALNYSAYSRDSLHPLNLSLLYPFQELQTLDLSQNLFTSLFDDAEGYKSLARFRKLETLDLSLNEFGNTVLPFLNAAASLTTLILRGNSINGTSPTKVTELDHLHKLEALDLRDNEFSGSLEELGICRLRNLRELNLRGNKFVGPLPLCFGNLTKLQGLDLSYNQLSGKMLPSLIGNMESLEYLSLSDNNFEGLFSLNVIANLSKLKVLKLSSTSNQLQVEADTSIQPKFQLTAIKLPYCNLEKIPSFLHYQKNLRRIDLSSNRLSGAFPTWLLENNPKLEALHVQSNSFSFFRLPRLVHNLRVLDVSSNNFDDELPENIGKLLPNIRHLDISDCRFQGHLPSSLGDMENIRILDVSRNKLSGSLPRSFLMNCHSLRYLKLSYNNFSGQIFQESANLTSLNILSIDNNQFSGEIGDGILNSSFLWALEMSNNNLSGAIPSWIGNLSNLCLLSASNNYIQGMIPVSLLNNSYMTFLDLSENMLSGDLPSRFSSSFGAKFYLHDNSITGPVPHTLLENLSILDLRNNKISGSIPQFSNTQNIIALLLRGNDLRGPIPKTLCELSNIRLLDLGQNRLNGPIPSCLNNLSFGMRNYLGTLSEGISIGSTIDMPYLYNSLILQEEFDPSYDTSEIIEVEFASKQRYDSYTGRPLDDMTGLDLSCNELNGEIPRELGDLRRIHVLNLSHNSLSGSIPESFSNLTDLESLDLSFNKLHGIIPPEIASIDSLAFFNVSYNNFSGVIPQGNHFRTMDPSNFLGNPLLCVPPTNTSCEVNDDSREHGSARKDDETAIDMEAFYWSLFATYATVLMGFLVFMCFDSPWRRAWFRTVDAFICMVKSRWL